MLTMVESIHHISVKHICENADKLIELEDVLIGIVYADASNVTFFD